MPDEKIIPVTDHLGDWTRPELADAAEAVEAWLEHPGAELVKRAIEDRLRFEQKIAMRSAATGDAAKHERTFGQWGGLPMWEAVAVGLVRAGKQAEREMRRPDAAEAA